MSEKSKIDEALKDLEAIEGDEVEVLVSKHDNEILSKKVTVREPFSEDVFRERVEKTEYGEVTIKRSQGRTVIETFRTTRWPSRKRSKR